MEAQEGNEMTNQEAPNKEDLKRKSKGISTLEWR
jgi:hypothetical protein